MSDSSTKFTDKERTGIARYGSVLLGIHSRLVIEGYFLDGGRIWNIFKVGTPVCQIEWDDETCQIWCEN